MAKRITVPLAYRQMNDDLGIKGWVESNVFPREEYFKSLDGVLNSLAAVQDNLDDDPDMVFEIFWIVVKKAQHVQDWIYENDVANASNDHSEDELCKSATWVIYQRYTREVTNGSWTRS